MDCSYTLAQAWPRANKLITGIAATRINIVLLYTTVVAWGNTSDLHSQGVSVDVWNTPIPVSEVVVVVEICPSVEAISQRVVALSTERRIAHYESVKVRRRA